MKKNKDDFKSKIAESIKLNRETNNIEFKDARSGLPSDIWRSITAFFNSPGGGYIVFGVKEDSQTRQMSVVGNNDIQGLQEKVVSYIENSISNSSAYSLEIMSIDNKDLVVLIICETEKEKKPCYRTTLGMDKGACIRVGNVNQSISEEELRSFLRYTPAYNFDKMPLENVEIKALDFSKIKDFFEKSAKKRGRKYSTDFGMNNLLNNLGILHKNEESFQVTLAGLLIFSNSIPQDFAACSRYLVRCVNYSGKSTSSTILDQRDVYGTLDDQVDDSLKFILRSIKTEAEIVGSKRIEKFEYPELALREMIVNALIHRDYSNNGTYVQITVFSDRIEITNPGTLPPGLTVENLKISQFSRNGTISRIMRDMDYMEEYGRGIDLIYSEMSNWGLLDPLFKNSSNSFKVTLLGKDYLSLNERQVKFWHALQNRNHLTASIAHQFFPDVSRPTINNDLKSMINLGLIRMKGSSSNSYYEPAY